MRKIIMKVINIIFLQVFIVKLCTKVLVSKKKLESKMKRA